MTALGAINKIFNVVKRQGPYAAAIVAGMALNLVMLILLARDGFYLAAFPVAVFSAKLFFAALSYWAVAHLVRRNSLSTAAGGEW